MWNVNATLVLKGLDRDDYQSMEYIIIQQIRN